ncbi:hypothetical protein TVAG_249540 [Trichomonas vaginalis G3]|uniref:3'-5' exonuclease domain-containing protein n=1 Tax=Trichomonas vaginalis (strain ATCC PRA-98 / G3) TaxID=412133 RepID=A2DCF7_TRIV3|nr:hypothetical protein TVAGG3_0956970 [Trichomonas vaginalis G3]EAY21894.1 hypothetical protein TVAG_249540 [Trichomonas vaginalis G3]KAI5487630.1 hypothetical protein TVAGG3_0956970 [Trichomonas vaginalis G3]|eukprot:XP_001582880.1 hypothetical protein [Trichomonas vaginalis G3]
MSNKAIREVTCPISKVKHIIVRKDDTEAIRALRIWATKLFVRMRRGESILLSMDCEGWKLGTIHKSLGLLQICEILDQSILIKPRDESQKSLRLKSGFLVHFPTTNEVIDILSGVLHHPNVILCTYDFTSDISSLMEAGVKINTKRIFDAQLVSASNTSTEPIWVLTDTQARSIIARARGMIGTVKEAQDAVNFMSSKKGNMFEFLTFLHRKDQDPFASMVDDDFYKYAAGDLVMTALAALYSFYFGFSSKTWELSAIKVKEFLSLQKMHQQVLMPSAVRQEAFLTRYNLKDLKEYQTSGYKIPLTDDSVIRMALTLYVKADMIVNLLKILPEKYSKSFSEINAQIIRNDLEGKLEEVKARIQTLSPFDDDTNIEEAQN